ncbi:MAG: purine-binding chemotaxis protein CheW [Lentisphaeraceae bacterium]|nr:purine-binding chemotaxis protein CheW [Lentisphaeraceae bacterium]
MEYEQKIDGVQRYLTFRLSEELFAVNIIDIQEVIRMMTMTRMPRSKSTLRGILNLRGKVIPVVDLRQKFALSPCLEHEKTCIAIAHFEVQDKDFLSSFLIDEIRQVVSIEDSAIESPPALGSEMNFLKGLSRINGETLRIIDLKTILLDPELYYKNHSTKVDL